MKTLKMICTAVVLALMLSIPGRAGEISTPGFTGDPNQPGVPAPTNPTEPASPSAAYSDPVNVGVDVILMTLAGLF